MIFNQINNAINSVDSSNTKASHIETNAASVSILINIYKFPILAIVRELSSNAFDANRSAGIAENDFTIHLPTSEDNIFYVKDNGNGMSNEDINNTYINFFTSTKRNTNALTGMFGLGAKTPFTYTDVITVESCFNGTKTIYAFYRDENGQLLNSNLTSIPTTEHGLKVSFGVKEEDFDKFYYALVRTCIPWASFPKIENTSGLERYLKTVFNFNFDYIKKINKMFKTDDIDYCFIKPFNFGHLNLEMGGVNYPILVDELDEQTTEIIDSKVSVIHAPIGSVDIVPSREELMYNKKTKDYIFSWFFNHRVLELCVSDDFVERASYYKNNSMNISIIKKFDKLANFLSDECIKKFKYFNSVYDDDIKKIENIVNSADKKSFLLDFNNDTMFVEDLDKRAILNFASSNNKTFVVLNDNVKKHYNYRSTGSSFRSTKSIYLSGRISNLKNPNGNYIFTDTSTINALKEIGFSKPIIDDFEGLFCTDNSFLLKKMYYCYFVNGTKEIKGTNHKNTIITSSSSRISFLDLQKSIKKLNPDYIVPVVQIKTRTYLYLNNAFSSTSEKCYLALHHNNYEISIEDVYKIYPNKKVLFVTSIISGFTKNQFSKLGEIKDYLDDTCNYYFTELKRIENLPNASGDEFFMSASIAKVIDEINKYDWPETSNIWKAYNLYLSNPSNKNVRSIEFNNLCPPVSALRTFNNGAIKIYDKVYKSLESNDISNLIDSYNFSKLFGYVLNANHHLPVYSPEVYKDFIRIFALVDGATKKLNVN